MRKVINLVLASLLLAGCGSAAVEPTGTPEPTSSQTAAPTATPDPTPNVEVDEGLFLVTVTLSPDLAEGVTQEELDAERQKLGYVSATLNEDGSVTYVMTKKQHQKTLEELRKTIDRYFEEVSASEDYPGIDSISANEDMTEIIVTMNTKDMGLQETFAGYALLFYGKIYQAYLGTPDASIRLIYVDSSREVIFDVNSEEVK